MYKSIILAKLALFALIFAGFRVPAHADEHKHLILPIKELTWISYRPNDDIEEVVAHFGKKYKTKVDSMTDWDMRSYVAGDHTRAMTWIISFDFDDRKKLNGISYTQNKIERKGIPVITGRGIKVGAGIAKVIERYGKVKEVINPKFPEAYFLKLPYPFLVEEEYPVVKNFVRLIYPFVIQETSQRGYLTFTTSYKKKGQSRKDAIVIKIEYKLNE